MAHMLCNGILVGCAGFAMYKIPPGDSPWGFTACTMGLCHGLLHIINGFTGDGGEESGCCANAEALTTKIMDIVPLPLVNIELYLKSASSNNIALGHGIHILPFCLFPLISKIEDAESSEEGEEPLETLRKMTILGNVFSLVFLAVNENNGLYGCMAAAAFSSKYVAIFMDSQYEGTECCFRTFFQSVFFLLTAFALGTDK